MESQSLLSASGDATSRQVAQVAFDNLQRPVDGGNAASTGQGRLQGLPDRTQDVVGRADLDEALQHVVDVISRLVGIDDVAVGVSSRDRPVRFVTPTASADWPVGHPPSRSVLQVPIMAQGEVFGTLYLPGKPRGGKFSAKDRKLAEALASVAGTAVENAELVDELRRRQAWQSATTHITTLLLSGADPQTVLPVLVGQVRRLGMAAAVAIVVPTEDTARLRLAVGTGLLHPRRVGETIPAERSISQLTRLGRAAIVVEHAAVDPRTAAVAALAPGVGPLVAAPLVAAPQVAVPQAVGPGQGGVGSGQGVLLVGRTTDKPPFQPPDAEMITAFAAHAGRALVLADARRRRELVRLVEDRERIAQQLSEQAMQALLGITTTVHGLTARMQTSDDARRLGEQVNRLDAVLREMRRAIFGLQLPEPDQLVRHRPWPGAAGA